MKRNMNSLMLVLTGSIYGFVLFFSSICSAASYPTSTATPLATDLSMNQYKLNGVGDIITKGPWVDVRAFGAVGDGVTDDTTAIQNALNYVGSSYGLKLLMPKGIYRITQTLELSLRSGWCWEGLTSNRWSSETRIVWGGAAGGTMFRALGCRWFEINNIQFNGNNIAGIGVQLRNGTLGEMFSDFCSRNLSIINITGSPGYALYLGEGDATPGLTRVNMYDLGIFNCTNGVVHNNGGGQGLTFYSPSIAGCTNGFYAIYGGFFVVVDGLLSVNTVHFKMNSGTLKLIGGVYESEKLIDWGNHDGGTIQLIGIQHTYATNPITYGGGNTDFISIGNQYAGSISVPVGSLVGAISINDKFDTGSFTKYANTAIIKGSQISLGTNFSLNPNGMTRINNLGMVGFINGDTTPSVSGSNMFLCDNSAPITITSFDDGVTSQIITIRFTNANTTIQRSASIRLSTPNWTPDAEDTLTLFFDGGAWYEVSRSSNAF